jgi:FixJ family two-component response regulator
MTVVWIVDDDESVLRGLGRLLLAEGFEVRGFADPEAFLAAHDRSVQGCAIIDLGLPGIDGLALQERLVAQGDGRPVIFLTGHGTIPAAVQAMRAGAVDFLSKPVEAEQLLAAVRAALAQDAATRSARAVSHGLRDRLSHLTPREREVLDEVVAGRMNKQIADRLGAAEKTIKVHRGRLMRKMGVRSVAELATLMTRLGQE